MSTGTQKWAGAIPDRLLPRPVVILYGRLSGGRCGPHPTRHRRLPVARAGMVESRIAPSAGHSAVV
ncbi:hypothetical protein LADH09A_002026 [Micromonospora sp. LAH09]|uniref:hypothetical protein n=1 Tax=Micromonospora cabrerizensis TaxID=2911213 RepID=UPI001EE95787|nr:hypothetical protein [Micromonospora cabrerizensis]MCG5468167.1 hypothetical protein [Micromonospora cabrerizensis]